ncbi:nucleotidyltransferase-like protein [Caldibacillus lycopersici]|uniref:Nucleotidyltransferase-like protein n=1 Tax=Perspicuibacillus lycopersici TaxID=1325689 RepID=A0AAE3IUX0_9BACI|nr:nucleotidyltransferase-like protein [Perspicuibacillus lycopersici]MCU9614657.1 nucleotidyltransferase-like protein [Perspicuibacillus lycopersici]
MENILRSIYQERASDPTTLGILSIENRDSLATITDTFDEILLIISKEQEHPLFVKHYEYEAKKLALYIVNEAQVKLWISKGTNRKVFDWFYYGKILFDRNDYLYRLIQEIKDFPFHERKLRIGLEFAKLIRTYMEGKTLYEKKQYLDAYSHIIHSLHYLGRVALIEKGYHPEITVWNQVKQIEPEVYKMYEELVHSEEPLHKKLELLFLASEFFIHSRTEIGSAHIMKVLAEKELWSIQEFMEHPELSLYATDLIVFIEYLIDKKYIAVELKESKGKSIFHRYYKKQ